MPPRSILFLVFLACFVCFVCLLLLGEPGPAAAAAPRRADEGGAVGGGASATGLPVGSLADAAPAELFELRPRGPALFFLFSFSEIAVQVA